MVNYSKTLQLLNLGMLKEIHTQTLPAELSVLYKCHVDISVKLL